MNQDSWDSGLTPEDIEKVISSHNRPLSKCLEIMGRLKHFIEAIQSEIGQELLKEVIQRIDDLFPKILNEKADLKEKIEYQVYLSILETWGIKIKRYFNSAKKIKEKTNGS